jgi:Cu+-exporting ATPase
MERNMTRIDPVCKMQIEEKKAAGKSYYKGQSYYFCSMECKDEFDQNPAQYASKSTEAPRHGKIAET